MGKNSSAISGRHEKPGSRPAKYGSELATNRYQLKIEADDGKLRLTRFDQDARLRTTTARQGRTDEEN
jgi:hypothetical protein